MRQYPGMRRVLLIVLLLLTGCSAHRSVPAPGLAGVHGCGPDRSCGTLRVPLDRSGRTAGTLDLNVETLGSGRRGDLLVLTGGPGQPGVPFADRMAKRLSGVLADYRVILFDQRGTGGTALVCPALQKAMGSSDLSVPKPSAVTGCAASLGDRRAYFGTMDTVADIEELRQALHVGKWAIDGVSYGTYTAQRYVIAHPGRVSRLVLDSVVRVNDLDALSLGSMRASGRVLTKLCGSCAGDLAYVVRHGGDGPGILNALVDMSVADPSFAGVPAALRAARRGSPARLNKIVDAYRSDGTPATELSQGLHAATLCADSRQPWGDSASPLAGRAQALKAAQARLTDAQVWPFDQRTAVGTGFIASCLYWPPMRPTPPPATTTLPNVPTLLLAGDRDLSTPLEGAQATRGRLVVVPGAGHSVQRGPAGQRAVTDFLLSR